MLNIPIHNLSENERERVSHGMSICNSDFPDSDIVILSYGGRIYAIGKVEQNKILVKKYLRYYEKDYVIIRFIIVS